MVYSSKRDVLVQRGLEGKLQGSGLKVRCFFSVVFYFTPLFKKEQKIKGKYSNVNIRIYAIQVTAFWNVAVWHECVHCSLRVRAERAATITSPCWDPYILCFKKWTLKNYSTMILCTFLIAVYGMLCIHFMLFLGYCFHLFFFSPHFRWCVLF